MWSTTDALANGFFPSVALPVAWSVLPSEMLTGLTVTLFVTVAFADDAWAATLNTPQCGELSPINAQPAAIINVKKSAAHTSRDLLTERVTRDTNFQMQLTQRACYHRQKHGSDIKRCGFASANAHLYKIATRFRYASLLASPLDSLNR
jgi:hypothetical protein